MNDKSMIGWAATKFPLADFSTLFCGFLIFEIKELKETNFEDFTGSCVNQWHVSLVVFIYKPFSLLPYHVGT